MDIGGEGVAQGWACQMPGQDTTVQEAVTLCCVARHLPINVPPSTKEYNNIIGYLWTVREAVQNATGKV